MPAGNIGSEREGERVSNYDKNNECAGCGEHISSYHGKGCVYDPDFQPEIACNCPTCEGKCERADEYSEDGETCEYCFREHTYFDEESGGYVFYKYLSDAEDNKRTINDIKREYEEANAVNV